MTFSFVPACSAPMVTTAASVGATSRETIVCSLRPVRPAPEHPDLQAVRSGGHDPFTPIEMPRWQAHDMLSQHDIGLLESFKESVVNHRLRALSSPG